MSDFKTKCIEIDFGWGFAPDLAGKAYSKFPGTLAEIKVTYF